MARKRLISKKRPPYFHKPIGLKRAQFKRLRPPRDFTLRKRGLRRPVEDDLERRAVSKERVIGTLPERIIYKELLRRRITFDFQSSLLGGRQKLGGMVADYILYLPLGTIILRIQTQYFHTTHEAKLKDDEQRAVLESLRDPISGKYFIVYDVWDYIVYDAHRLNDWLNRVLSPKAHTFYLGGPGRGVWMPSRAEWEALVGQVRFLMETNAVQESQIEDLLRRLSGATLSDITHGSLGLVTAGEFRAGDGKVPDVDFTGTRMYYDPANRTGAIEGQASGVKQFYLDTDGIAYAGAGAVKFGATGLIVTQGSTGPHSINWEDSNSIIRGAIYTEATGGSENAELTIGAVTTGQSFEEWMVFSQSLDIIGLYGGDVRIGTTGKTLQFFDANTEIWEDGSSNLSFKDANAGTKILTNMRGDGTYGIDSAQKLTHTLAVNAVADLFTASNDFSGLFVVSDYTYSGGTALFLVGQGVIVLVSQSAGNYFTITKDTASKINVYQEADRSISVQNKQAGSASVSYFGIRTRDAS